MSWDAVLFDFDETLADTSQLKHLRETAWRRKDDSLWAEYFDKVRFADPIMASNGGAVSETLISLMSLGMPVAVVTSSPSKSVTAWFRHRYDRIPSVIVGYREARRPKPWPDPFLVALNRLGIPVGANVLSVGDDAKDVLAAHRAGIVSSTFYRAVPLSAAADIYLPSTQALYGFGPDAGTENRHAAALVTTGLAGFDRSAVTDGHVLVGGRYVTSGGAIHDEIIDAKKGHWSPTLIEAASLLVQHAVGEATDGLVTTIPPREGDFDRFKTLRSEISNRLGVTQDGTVLSWTKTVGRLKSMGAAARQKAMAGAFVSRDVSGQRVIILDDVRTTGSTLAAAARAIQSAGGDPVVVALAQTLSTRIDLPVQRNARYEYPMIGSPSHKALRAETQRQAEETRRQEEETRRQEEETRRRRRQAELEHRAERLRQQRDRQRELREAEEARALQQRRVQEAERAEARRREDEAVEERQAKRRRELAEEKERLDEAKRRDKEWCRSTTTRRRSFLALEAVWSEQINNHVNNRNARYVERCGDHYHLTGKDPKQPQLQVGTADTSQSRELLADLPLTILGLLKGDAETHADQYDARLGEPKAISAAVASPVATETEASNRLLTDLTIEAAKDGAMKPPGSGTRWSIQEIESLEAEWSDGRSLEELAGRHGRTVSAIRHQLDDLGLIDAEGHRIANGDRSFSNDQPLPIAEQIRLDVGHAPGTWVPRSGSRRGESWTTEEDAALAGEWHNGMTVKEIAEVHHRSNGAIRSRLVKLGLVD